MIYTKFITSSYHVILVADEIGLTYLYFYPEKSKNKFQISKDWVRNDRAFSKAKKQVEGYFQGKQKKFDIPIHLIGTEFQKKVWHALAKIPYGKTCSYKDIAVAIKNPKAYRAVGMACHNNRIPLIIPCHRVIASNGLGGFAGGLKLKQSLLSIESPQGAFKI